jgi:tetratricopeptide (TPR) repeat protein
MSNEDYYFSEESKVKGKQIYNDKKEYLKTHPKDFAMKGAEIHSIIWSMLNTLPKEEQKIILLTGEGKYYEEIEDYEKAIELYKKADDLTLKVCEKDIKELIKEHGSGDYLYTANKTKNPCM